MIPTAAEVRDNLRQDLLFNKDTDTEEIGASLIANATSILDSKRGPRGLDYPSVRRRASAMPVWALRP